MGVGGCGENLPPRTLARVARDVRDLVKSPPEGVRLVVDEETGMPGSLAEIVVRYNIAMNNNICFLLIFLFSSVNLFFVGDFEIHR
jgi:hypothetical protein